MAHVCFTLQVDPGKLDAYRAAHAAVWPEMLSALHATGWRNYRLFLRPDGLLVGTLETDDFAAAQEAMARTEVNARWQAAMAEFFPVLGELRPDEGMLVLDQIFHLEEQLTLRD
ncbi:MULTISPECIES: L-rhamnose mutarotase [Actinoplanes]|uniref:L-rhamnose mutarotase n=2 Tax=Actinoplanes TaxID=1865 RepID=A0A0X3V6S4_9ACTN|nr:MULTISPECIES: L-rhamnose mutarotase [Actinoplanes]KUL40440.1 L-rhamnose mutarotase [Actinoplanes awajinensis subsp. mycoplanecinus]GIE64073.1 L-rhamnose mutarotase [Actinoplanes palleronii]